MTNEEMLQQIQSMLNGVRDELKTDIKSVDAKLDNLGSELKLELKTANQILGEFYTPKEQLKELSYDVDLLKSKMFDVEVTLKRRP